MAFTFIGYLLSVYFMFKKRKNQALIVFAITTVTTLLLYAFHATSSLDLNF